MLAPATALAEVTREELDEALVKVREVSRQLDGELTDLDRSIGLETSYENRIRVIEQQLLDRQREVVMMELLAKERVQAMYMNAGTNRFQTVLSVEEFGQVGTRTAYLDTLADQEVDVVNQLLFLQNDSVRLQAELETLLSDQSVAVDRLEDSSSDIYDTLQIANDEYQVIYSEWQKQEAERRARKRRPGNALLPQQPLPQRPKPITRAVQGPRPKAGPARWPEPIRSGIHGVSPGPVGASTTAQL